MLVRVEQAPFEKWNLLVPHRRVAGRRDVVQRGEDQPQPIVGELRTHALPARLVPPVLHVALDELPRRGAQQLLAQHLRPGEDEREHVLQLIAEAERAARLIERRPSPHAARERR